MPAHNYLRRRVEAAPPRFYRAVLRSERQAVGDYGLPKAALPCHRL